MDEQRLYSLVVWSPPFLLTPFQSAQEESGSSAQPTTPNPSAATLPNRLCPDCPRAADWSGLRQQVGFWKSLFERCKQREEGLRQQLAQEKNWQRLYEQAQERERVLQQHVAALEAEIRVLEQRLRGRKSEKKKRHAEAIPTSESDPLRQRGQQPTNPAPARRTFDHLRTEDEARELLGDAARCPHCGAAFAPFPGTDDGDLLEIEVGAYRRRYHRHRYRKTCTCAATPALLTAPPPPKLIPKGYLGISVWVLLLLEKYAAYQPTYRFLALLRSFGVDLPMGTVTDGLRKLVPLFEPLYQALAEHQRQEHHWHCDETRWLVFVEQEGKTGPNWSLWVFCSPEAVVFVLDPTRTHHVPEKHLAKATGIANVDRASVYKAMAQVKDGEVVLAFCWAHVRRDFLEVLTGYAELSDWVISWLEEIRELYRRNDARLEALNQGVVATENREPPPGAQGASAGAIPRSTAEVISTAAEQHVSQATAVTENGQPLSVCNGASTVALPSSLAAETSAAAEQHLREHVAHLVQRRDAELQQPDLSPACTKILTSLQRHWSGLTVFLEHPEVPLDNNAAERAERGPVVARKNYYGSGALWSGRLAAMLFSLLETLALWKLCPLRWLTAYLTACAEAGGKPPEQATAFVPWNLTAEQKQQWALPSSQAQRPATVDTS